MALKSKRSNPQDQSANTLKNPKTAAIMDFHKDWNILEADFRREYGIDLVRDRQLSWRSFLVLAQSLSKNSVWTMTYQGRSNGDLAIEDAELGEKAADNIW